MEARPGGDLSLAFASEYLSVFPGGGRPFEVRKLGLTFYMLKNCLAVSAPNQILAPAHADGEIPCIFLESCPYFGNEVNLVADLTRFFSEAGQRPLVRLEEAAPFYPPGSRNLWHWSTESLPKLLALEDSGYTGPYIVPHNCKMVDESLAMHGIAKERLYYNNASYLVDSLMLPPRLSGFDLPGNLPLAAFLRERILGAAGREAGTRRAYVRRVGARRIANEEELLPVLDEYGFARLTPEELPLKEQYRFMSNVECSVMAHGANSTLTLAQRPGSTCIECFGNRYISYNNLHAVRLLGLRYHALVEDLDPTCAPVPARSTDEYLEGGRRADLNVDPVHLRILLESALGGTGNRKIF